MDGSELFKAVMDQSVFIAHSCTEIEAGALTCSASRHALGYPGIIDKIEVSVSPGVYKDGFAAGVSGTGGERGLAIAAALGAICGKPELMLESISQATPEDLAKAKKLIKDGKVKVSFDPEFDDPYVRATIYSEYEVGVAVISGNHTNIMICHRNGKNIDLGLTKPAERFFDKSIDYQLRKLTIDDLVRMAAGIDEEDRTKIQQGIEMNCAISRAGLEISGYGRRLSRLAEKGDLGDSLISVTQSMVACGIDARMQGLGISATTSGRTGNGGITTIVGIYSVGMAWVIDISRIQEAIALAHLMNSYAQCYLGKLSAMCNCAVCGSIALAAGITYLLTNNPTFINNAINGVIDEVAGISCEGARNACAQKAVNAVGAAIRASVMALDGYVPDCSAGILAGRAEESIRNLGELAQKGMGGCNKVIINTLAAKSQALNRTDVEHTEQ